MRERLLKVNLGLSPYPQLKRKICYSSYVYFNKKTLLKTLILANFLTKKSNFFTRPLKMFSLNNYLDKNSFTRNLDFFTSSLKMKRSNSDLSFLNQPLEIKRSRAVLDNTEHSKIVNSSKIHSRGI
jgi:hypothetical protein